MRISGKGVALVLESLHEEWHGLREEALGSFTNLGVSFLELLHDGWGDGLLFGLNDIGNLVFKVEELLHVARSGGFVFRGGGLI